MEKQWGKEEILGKYAPYAVRIQEGQWGRRRGEEGENKLSGVMKWATAEYHGHAYSLFS